MRSALGEASLKWVQNVSKANLFAKNMKKKLAFAKMHKDYKDVHDREREWSLLMRQGLIDHALMGFVSVGFCNKNNLLTCIVKQTIKHDGVLIMLWSCMTTRRVGSLYNIE